MALSRRRGKKICKSKKFGGQKWRPEERVRGKRIKPEDPCGMEKSNVFLSREHRVTTILSKINKET